MSVNAYKTKILIIKFLKMKQNRKLAKIKLKKGRIYKSKIVSLKTASPWLFIKSMSKIFKLFLFWDYVRQKENYGIKELI